MRTRRTDIARIYSQRRGPGEECVAVNGGRVLVRYANGELMQSDRSHAARLLWSMRDAARRHPDWTDGRIGRVVVRIGR